MSKISNKLTESMMTALEETKNFKLTEIQGLTFMHALLKGRNYTKLHYGGKYLWKWESFSLKKLK